MAQPLLLPGVSQIQPPPRIAPAQFHPQTAAVPHQHWLFVHGQAQRPVPAAPAHPPVLVQQSLHLTANKSECEDQQCAEEDMDREECGDETQAPRERQEVCGVDRRPFLPLGFFLATAAAASIMQFYELPLLREYLSGFLGSLVSGFLAVTYTGTLLTMFYCAAFDPGQMKRLRVSSEQSPTSEASPLGSTPTEKDLEAGSVELPPRAHKSWLYRRPIRRYDHYCRWLTNVIGLLNHREFFLMLVGLVITGIAGTLIDFALVVVASSRPDHTWFRAFILVAHLTYSVILLVLAYPIFRLHAGLICRNETAYEWKINKHYVFLRDGQRIAARDVTDEEFDLYLDQFEYDPQRNRFDQGVVQNCWVFWCTPRWVSGELGNF